MQKLFSLEIDSPTGRFKASQAWLAARFWERLGGLLSIPPLAVDEALVIEQCNSVHTFFMRYPIDVVFCSPTHEVLAIKRAIEPYRLVSPVKCARYVIEIASASDTSMIQPGAQVVIRSVSE